MGTFFEVMGWWCMFNSAMIGWRIYKGEPSFPNQKGPPYTRADAQSEAHEAVYWFIAYAIMQAV